MGRVRILKPQTVSLCPPAIESGVTYTWLYTPQTTKRCSDRSREDRTSMPPTAKRLFIATCESILAGQQVQLVRGSPKYEWQSITTTHCTTHLCCSFHACATANPSCTGLSPGHQHEQPRPSLRTHPSLPTDGCRRGGPTSVHRASCAFHPLAFHNSACRV